MSSDELEMCCMLIGFSGAVAFFHIGGCFATTVRVSKMKG